MKRFLLKIAVFILPLAAVCIPAFIHLNEHRELVSLDEAIDLSRENNALIGFAYSDPGYLLKYRAVERLTPEVLALGSSRVLQIRSNYFKNPEAFYNAGRAVRRVRDFRRFLETYPTNAPRVLILGLDQNFFDENFDDFSDEPRLFTSSELGAGGRFIKGFKGLAREVRKDKYQYTETKSAENIGAFARWTESGFRADGSYCYGGIISKGGNYKFATTLKRIEQRGSRFEAAEEIHSAAVSEIAILLKECKNRGIHVVAFLPPFAERVYQEMKKSSSSYPYVFELHATLSPVFEEFGMNLFDYSSMKSLGASDYETIDGFHGSEVCYLRMMIDMCAEEPLLDKYIDIEKAQDYLRNSYSSRQLVREVEENSPHPPSALINP